MTIDHGSPIAIVARADYDLLLRDGEIIEPLRGRPLIFIHSVRTSRLPPLKSCAEFHLIELRDCNDYLTQLLRAIMSRHSLSQVLTISEQDLSPVVAARNALGFSGISVSQAERYRDKVVMKRALDGCGIPIPAFADGIDDRGIRDLFTRYGKLVAKPRDGYGAQGISVLTKPSDVDAFLEWQDSRRCGYLVEQFVNGDVHHLDAVVRNGEILFSSLGRYEVPPLNFSGRRWAGTRFTNRKDAIHKAACDLLSTVLRAFGTLDGVFHFEFFFSDGILTFGEIAIRPVGGGVAEAIYDAFGVHLVEEHVRIQLGLPPGTASAREDIAYGASLLMLSEVPGVISRYEGLDANQYRSLKRVNFHRVKGEWVAPTRYSADSLLTCSLAASDASVLDVDILAIQRNACVVLSQVQETAGVRSSD